MKKKIILTKNYLEEVIERLKKEFELIIVEDTGKNLHEVLKENQDAEALISFLSDNISKEIIDICKNLKIIANYAVGYNNINYKHAIEKGIYVTNTPDILTAATADLTMALILSVSRRIVESDEFVRKGKFNGWEAKLMLGKELNGSTIGIIGMGRIGLALALRAKAFGMNVIYYSKTRKQEIERIYGFKFVRFIELIKESDLVSIHIPYSKDVHHLFNKDVFDLMKKDAIFINVSRGALMDETCLAEELEKNKRFGAGLDVYEFEPKVTEKLKKLKNVVLTPHIGSATYKTRLAMAMMTYNDVVLALSGKKPAYLIPECKL